MLFLRSVLEMFYLDVDLWFWTVASHWRCCLALRTRNVNLSPELLCNTRWWKTLQLLVYGSSTDGSVHPCFSSACIKTSKDPGVGQRLKKSSEKGSEFLAKHTFCLPSQTFWQYWISWFRTMLDLLSPLLLINMLINILRAKHLWSLMIITLST